VENARLSARLCRRFNRMRLPAFLAGTFFISKSQEDETSFFLEKRLYFICILRYSLKIEHFSSFFLSGCLEKNKEWWHR